MPCAASNTGKSDMASSVGTNESRFVLGFEECVADLNGVKENRCLEPIMKILDLIEGTPYSSAFSTFAYKWYPRSESSCWTKSKTNLLFESFPDVNPLTFSITK